MEKIAVIGIGRLGLCLALNLEKSGFEVWGVDSIKSYIDEIKTKIFSSPEPFVNEYLRSSKHFHATTNYSVIHEQKIRLVFVVVPTPSSDSGGFDHTHLNQVVEELIKEGNKKNDLHLIINSTTMPGYCDALNKRLNKQNIQISYNPEFIAQGTIMMNQQNPDQVLIGEANVEVGNEIQRVYEKLCKNKPVYCRMSPLSAEITKLATNCFLTTKIAFANAIGDLAIQAGAEPEKVLKAIGSDSRIGNKYFNYGFGYGGPCFPRDNKALIRFASDQKQNLSIGEATEKANQMHHEFLVWEWSKKYSNEQTIIFDSVTYKKDTDILEESQQLRLAVELAKAGKKVIIKERPSIVYSLKTKYGDLFSYEIKHGD